MGRKKKEVTMEDFEAKENGQTSADVPVIKKRRGRPASVKIAAGLRAIMEEEKKPIVIKSGSLKGIFCDYSYDHTVAANTTNGVSIKSHVVVHDDLTEAFRRLNVHLAVICEEVNADDIPDIDNLPLILEGFELDHPKQDPLAVSLAKYSVSSFRIAGNGENEGVILTGQKQLSTMDAVQLTTPVTKYFSEYAFVNELRIAIDDVVKEIEEYMNGKQAPQRQTEMEFGEDDGFEHDEDL